ncbi:MAG: hypothetical protein PVSMB11_07310 [Desulfuromonadaceae bacterium]
MQITPGLGVAIMMNNYFHDVATALLAASAFTLHAIVRVQAVQNNVAGTLFFIRTYDMMVKFFKFALWWIILGGIPRTIFFTSFEWNHFADKLQIPALIVKHLLMFVLVVWGIIAWKRLKRKVEALRASLPTNTMP